MWFFFVHLQPHDIVARLFITCFSTFSVSQLFTSKIFGAVFNSSIYYNVEPGNRSTSVATSFLWLGELCFSLNFRFIYQQKCERYILRGKTHVDNIYTQKRIHSLWQRCTRIRPKIFFFFFFLHFRPTRSEDAKKQFAMWYWLTS